MRVTALNEEADRRGFIVAYLQGTGSFLTDGPTFNVGTCCGYAATHGVDDVAFAVAVATEIARHEHGDSTRIFAAGFSVGGMLALKLACDVSGVFAGVADVEGAMPDVRCAPQRGVSVLLIQGDADEDLRADEVELRASQPAAYAATLEAAANFWAVTDGCARGWSLASTVDAFRLSAPGCRGGAVTLYSVHGSGHSWPGGRRSWAFGSRPTQAVGASALVLDFFGTARPASVGIADAPTGTDRVPHAPPAGASAATGASPATPATPRDPAPLVSRSPDD
jgi:polyhydroxybutyrate depolymerase